MITSGLLLPDSLSCNNLTDAEVKQALINSSRKTILCMDISKVGRAYLARFALLNSINVLITDTAISNKSRTAIVQTKYQVHKASVAIPPSFLELKLTWVDVAVEHPAM